MNKILGFLFLIIFALPLKAEVPEHLRQTDYLLLQFKAYSPLTADGKQMLLNQLTEEVFSSLHSSDISKYDKNSYAAKVRMVFESQFISEDVRLELLMKFQDEWINRYFSTIGTHSSFLEFFEKHSFLTKVGALLGFGASVAFMARHFHQEIRLIKAIVKASPRKAFWSILVSPFGKTGAGSFSGLAASEAKDKGLDAKEEVSKQAMPIPISPAHIATSQDSSEFNLNYDEYVLVRDVSAITGGAFGGYYVAYSLRSRIAHRALRNYITKTAAARTAQKTAWRTMMFYLSKARFVPRVGPTLLAGLVVELGSSYAIDTAKGAYQKNKVEKKQQALREALRTDSNAHKLLPFYAEVYLNASSEYVYFLINNYIEQVHLATSRYKESRFCTEFNLFYRKYIKPFSTNIYNSRLNDFANRYSTRVSLNSRIGFAETEFEEINKINVAEFKEKIYDKAESNRGQLKKAQLYMDEVISTLKIIESASSEEQRAYYNHLVVRAENLKRMTFSFSPDETINLVMASSELLMNELFVNKEVSKRENDGRTDFNRFCYSIDKKMNMVSNDDTYGCLIEKAREFSCTPDLAPYGSY